jgi:hypothetical protein
VGAAAELQTVEIVEIRARRDRNRLLGTYDPARRVLRLFHRGETVTVQLDAPRDVPPPIDVRQNVE